jgi:hypothetical protein
MREVLDGAHVVGVQEHDVARHALRRLQVEPGRPPYGGALLIAEVVPVSVQAEGVVYLAVVDCRHAVHGVDRGAYLDEIRRASLGVLDPIDVRAPKGFGA